MNIPPVVRNKALALGFGAWLEALPARVRRLEAGWNLTVGPAFPDATEAFVAPATRADGQRAVLKVLLPGESHEAMVLRQADGRGCARLLEEDEHALLMERLGPSLYQLGLPWPQRQEILLATARQIWRPASGLPSGARKAAWLSEFISQTWLELGKPCSRKAIDHALRCAERRLQAHCDETAVLVHGDVHQWNALQAGDGFKLVDPDGLLAEPEYDLGILMREDPLEGDLPTRARWLARQTGLNAEAIWEWGVVERVSTGLLATRIELQPLGSEMLAAAERATAQKP